MLSPRVMHLVFFEDQAAAETPAGRVDAILVALFNSVGEIASVAYAVPSACRVANTQLLAAVRLLEVYTGSIDFIVCVREYVSSAPHGEFRASNMGNMGTDQPWTQLGHYHRNPTA